MTNSERTKAITTYLTALHDGRITAKEFDGFMEPLSPSWRTAMDNPRVRNDLSCPLCSGSKARGLIACWPCYRSHELKYGN